MVAGRTGQRSGGGENRPPGGLTQGALYLQDRPLGRGDKVSHFCVIVLIYTGFTWPSGTASAE